MEAQSTRGRLYASAAEGWRAAGRGDGGERLRGPGVLLDKYREKQRHGGSNENENKGALRNYGSPVPCAAGRRDAEETEIRFRRTLRTLLTEGGKNRQNETNDVERKIGVEGLVLSLSFSLGFL